MAGKPIHCKAAVARAAGEPLVIEEVVVAPPRAREVRLKIICTSLCHSDVTFWKLKYPPACFSRILGHEAVGIVESVGEGVLETEFDVGDYVVPTFLADCGGEEEEEEEEEEEAAAAAEGGILGEEKKKGKHYCVDCKSKKSNLCLKFPFKVSPWMPRDEGTTRFTDLKSGENIYHFLHVSSFTEYTVVDVAHLVKVSPAIPPNRACLLSCGVSTGFGAAWKTANVEPGSTVVIFGLGVIGLGVAEGARRCGATRIIGVDTNPEKFEMGKKFGVTEFVHPPTTCGDKPVSEVIKEMTEGGADYCFECVGLGSLVEEAYACCRQGWGKTIVLGVDQPGATLTFKSFDVLHLGKTLMGSLFGGLKPKSDIPVLVERYMNKELQLDDFVTHEMGLDDVNEAFELLVHGKCLRCVLWMDKDKLMIQPAKNA